MNPWAKNIPDRSDLISICLILVGLILLFICIITIGFDAMDAEMRKSEIGLYPAAHKRAMEKWGKMEGKFSDDERSQCKP